jgi:LysR family glycine cleavage system transcriptional activator
MRSPLSALPPHASLRPFEAAARLGSISAAARELGVTQPAVSRHLDQLEADLRQPLFERSARGLRLTEAGRKLQAAVGPALFAIAEAAESLRAPDRDRTIRLIANTGFAQQWLAPRLAALRAAVPDVYLRLIASDREEEFDEGDYDLGIRFGSGEWAQSESIRLLPELVQPVCAPSYLEERRALRSAQLTAAALVNERLLHMDEISQRWLTWRSWFDSQGVDAALRRPKLLYASYPLVLQAAMAGEGLALGWHGLVDDPIARGWLVALPLVTRRDTHGYFLCRRPLRQASLAKRRALDRVVAWFVAGIKE